MPEPRTVGQVRRSRDVRRVMLALLVVFVLLGAAGVFGTRTAERTASGGGFEVSVTYPAVSRPGHAVRYEVEVRRAGGFGGQPLRMRLSSDYFDLFDENGFSPDPEASTSDGEYDYVEFLPPLGEVFGISVDTRVEPAVQRGRSGEVSVLDGTGEPVVTVEYRTRIWP
jgi:hypothetical protein